MFTNEEIELIKNWAASNDPNAHSVAYKGGTIYVIGNKSFDITDGYELIKMKDFFNRLKTGGLIEQVRTTRSGDPVYQLTLSAYSYVNSIDNKL